MELKDAKTLIKGMDKGDEVLSAIVGHIAEADTKVSDAENKVNKANEEAKGLRKRYKEPLKALGLEMDPEKGDWKKTIEGWKEGAAGAGADKDKLKGQIASYQADQTKTNDRLNALETENKNLKAKEKKTTISKELNEAFGEGVYAKGAIIDNLIHTEKAKLSESGKVVIVVGGKELPAKEGFDALVESGKIETKVSSGGGSGGQGSGEKKKKPGDDEKTQEKLDSWDLK